MDVVLVGLSLPGVENHAIGALRAALRAASVKEAFVPFTGFSSLDSNLASVLSLRPRVVGISLQTVESALAVAVFARLLRERGFRGRVVLGGHFATLNAEALLRAGAGVDAVVRFAGEEALVAIGRGGLDDPNVRCSIPGLAYLDEDGSVKHGASPRWTSPSVLARAPRGEPLPEHLGFAAADLVVSRGCEARCSYCCIAAASDVARREAGDAAAGYERRSIGALAEEIAALHHEHGARVFNFMDDNVLPPDPEQVVDWALGLRARLDAKRVPALALSLQLRADAVTERSAQALARLGLVRAYVGVDGYSASQLRALGRRADAQAGQRALELLSRIGVFSVVNALLVGPTIPFESALNEIEALSLLQHAPVHLLPIEVRAGTGYFRAAERRGLVEGGVLAWHYRFADPRTERLAEILTSFPTRLAERSVPIALYDLGYNLGIARRLIPGADVATHAASYVRITAEWNQDQVRVLRRAASVAAHGSREEVENFVSQERDRVTLLDRGLRDAADALVADLESRVSRLRCRPVAAHARGRLLGGVALSMSLAACGGAVNSDDHSDTAAVDARSGPDAKTAPSDAGGTPDTGGSSGMDASVGGSGSADAGGVSSGGGPLADGSADACDDPSEPIQRGDAFELPTFCPCEWGSYSVTFDADGRAVGFRLADGGALTPELETCLTSLLARYCYPSLADTTQSFSSHCWIA